MIINGEIKDLTELLTTIRRDLHKIPETAFNEFKTAQYIESFMKKIGATYEKEIVRTGIVVFFEGSEPNKTLCFRADMDALDVEEQNAIEFKSEHSNKMHACGHDGHMAILMGLAKFLKDKEGDIKDNILLLFQPAEEGPGGALPIIESGVLKKYGVTEIYGLHLFPNLEEGKIGVRPGPMMSQTGEFDIEIIGKSGHGAMPHQAIDSVVIASDFILKLQTIISRGINPIDSAVITIGKIASGEIRNVIAKSAILEGTMRAFKQEVYDSMKNKTNNIAKALEIAYGCNIIINYRDMYPAVTNNEALTHNFISCQDSGVEIIDPIMLAEDFAYYQREIPGVFFFLGTKNEEKNYCYPLHNGCFNFDEGALTYGLQAYINVLVKGGSIIGQ